MLLLAIILSQNQINETNVTNFGVATDIMVQFLRVHWVKKSHIGLQLSAAAAL